MEILNIVRAPFDYVGPLKTCILGEQKPFVHRHLKAMIYEIGRTHDLTKDVVRLYNESDYKVGLRTIVRVLREQGISVNFRQIRRLIQPNRKKNHVIKIPYASHDIFEAITKLIDNHPDLHNKCLKKRKSCRGNSNTSDQKECYCKHILIGPLFFYLSDSQFNLRPDGKMLCKKFVDDKLLCKKTSSL